MQLPQIGVEIRWNRRYNRREGRCPMSMVRLSTVLILGVVSSCGSAPSQPWARGDARAVVPLPDTPGAFLVTCADGSQETRWSDFVRDGLICLGAPHDLTGKDFELSARWAVENGIIPAAASGDFQPDAAMGDAPFHDSLRTIALRVLGPVRAGEVSLPSPANLPLTRAQTAWLLRDFVRSARVARGLPPYNPGSFEDAGYEISDVAGLPQEAAMRDMLNYCAATFHLYDNAAGRLYPMKPVSRAEAAEALFRFENCLSRDIYPWLGHPPDFATTPDFDFPGVGVGSFLLPAHPQPSRPGNPWELVFRGERRGLPLTVDAESVPRAATFETSPELLARVEFARDLARGSRGAPASLLRFALALNPVSSRSVAQGRIVAWQPSATAFPQGKSYRVFAQDGTLMDGRAFELARDLTVTRGVRAAETWIDLTRKFNGAGSDPGRPTWFLFEDASVAPGHRARYQALLRLDAAPLSGHAPFEWSSFAWGVENPLVGPRFSELPDTGEEVFWSELPLPESLDDSLIRYVHRIPGTEVSAEITARHVDLFQGETGELPLEMTLRGAQGDTEVVVYRLVYGDSHPPAQVSVFRDVLAAGQIPRIDLAAAASLRLVEPASPLHSLLFVVKSGGRAVVVAALHQYSAGGGGGQGGIFPF